MEDSEEGLFLANFFRLWFAIRRTHTLEHISGDDTLDMQPGVQNKAFPWAGKVPLPPVMIQQLDMILTLGVLQPLRKRYLADLQRHIGYRSSTSWMLVYLTVFMGSHGCAVTTAENYNSARRHGLKVWMNYSCSESRLMTDSLATLRYAKLHRGAAPCCKRISFSLPLLHAAFQDEPLPDGLEASAHYGVC